MENALEFFAQDSYKVTSALTLELGLRYAWNKTPNEAMDRFVNFDSRTASLVPAGDPYEPKQQKFSAARPALPGIHFTLARP